MKNRNLDHKDDWATPPDFLEKIRKEYGEFFDPCPWHHDVNKWNGLTIPWQGINFINPPYSLKLKTQFVLKAINESIEYFNICIMLLPVSTSTKLFHNYVDRYKSEIRFIEGRLRFIGINAKGQYVNYDQITETTKETIEWEGIEIPKYVNNSGMHDSMIVIF